MDTESPIFSYDQISYEKDGRNPQAILDTQFNIVSQILFAQKDEVTYAKIDHLDTFYALLSKLELEFADINLFEVDPTALDLNAISFKATSKKRPDIYFLFFGNLVYDDSSDAGIPLTESALNICVEFEGQRYRLLLYYFLSEYVSPFGNIIRPDKFKRNKYTEARKNCLITLDGVLVEDPASIRKVTKYLNNLLEQE